MFINFELSLSLLNRLLGKCTHIKIERKYACKSKIKSKLPFDS